MSDKDKIENELGILLGKMADEIVGSGVAAEPAHGKTAKSTAKGGAAADAQGSKSSRAKAAHVKAAHARAARTKTVGTHSVRADEEAALKIEPNRAEATADTSAPSSGETYSDNVSATALVPAGQPVEQAAEQAVEKAVEQAAEQPAVQAEEQVPEDEAPENPEESPVESAPEEPSGFEELPATGELAKKLPLPLVAGIAVAALAIGLVIGMFFLSGPAPGDAVFAGKTTVSQNELDTPIATYSYQGTTGTVTVRDVIGQSSSLEAAQVSDGVYALPTADEALGVVRNNLILAAAEQAGIGATEEEIASYTESSFGSSDYEAIAEGYGMDAATLKSMMRDSCIMTKLHDSVVTGDVGQMPEPPVELSFDAEGEEADEEGESSDDEGEGSDEENAVSKEYADYIIALAGDEWDADAGTWASDDGPYASALASMYEITADGASYEAAVAAYYVAYQLYSEQESNANAQWTAYINDILGAATVQLNTLLV